MVVIQTIQGLSNSCYHSMGDMGSSRKWVQIPIKTNKYPVFTIKYSCKQLLLTFRLSKFTKHPTQNKFGSIELLERYDHNVNISDSNGRWGCCYNLRF